MPSRKTRPGQNIAKATPWVKAINTGSAPSSSNNIDSFFGFTRQARSSFLLGSTTKIQNVRTRAATMPTWFFEKCWKAATRRTIGRNYSLSANSMAVIQVSREVRVAPGRLPSSRIPQISRGWSQRPLKEDHIFETLHNVHFLGLGLI